MAAGLLSTVLDAFFVGLGALLGVSYRNVHVGKCTARGRSLLYGWYTYVTSDSTVCVFLLCYGTAEQILEA